MDEVCNQCPEKFFHRIMQFIYDYNCEVIAKFYASLYEQSRYLFGLWKGSYFKLHMVTLLVFLVLMVMIFRGTIYMRKMFYVMVRLI